MVDNLRLFSLIGRDTCCSILIVVFLHFCAFCLLTIMFVSFSSAGEASDIAFLLKVNPISSPTSPEIVRFNARDASELTLVATRLIQLYQKFISSQDAPTCNFIPSCSHFGMACIQEYGVMRGLLLTADRLLRCNGSQSSHYHRDEVTGKYVDAASDYATLK